MTLIACFNPSLVENMAGCLRLRPDQLVLLGDKAQMEAPAQRYRRILDQRGVSTQIRLCDTCGMNMTDISAMLAKLVKKEKDCVIDLTGGDETVVMAVGAMIAGMDDEEKNRVSVQKYDIAENADLDCVGNGKVVRGQAVALTVEELVALYGGVVHPGTYQPPRSCTPAQLEPLWDVVSQSPKEWNRAVAALAEFESRADSKTDVFLPLEYLRDRIPNFGEKETMLRQFLEKLSRCGVIEDHSSRNALSYSYTSTVFRYCTQKAGNVLEIKTLLEARALKKNNKPFFDDCQTGVNIDWDGIVYDPADRVPETRNEIDLVLMHGLTPLFISCKNGNIGDEELYKLHTVADRFGGPYARKMLIATDLDRKSAAANRAFIQRAWDMDIFLVTDAAELSKEEWKQIFVQAMQ